MAIITRNKNELEMLLEDHSFYINTEMLPKPKYGEGETLEETIEITFVEQRIIKGQLLDAVGRKYLREDDEYINQRIAIIQERRKEYKEFLIAACELFEWLNGKNYLDYQKEIEADS